jgi:hypothetical protein
MKLILRVIIVILLLNFPSYAGTEVLNKKVLHRMEQAIDLCVTELRKRNFSSLIDDVRSVMLSYRNNRVQMLFTVGEVGIFSQRSKNYRNQEYCQVDDQKDMKIVRLLGRKGNYFIDKVPDNISYFDQRDMKDQYDFLYLRQGNSLNFKLTALRKFDVKVYDEIFALSSIDQRRLYYIPFDLEMDEFITAKNMDSYRVFTTKIIGKNDDINKLYNYIREVLYDDERIIKSYSSFEEIIIEEKNVRAKIINNDSVEAVIYNDGKVLFSSDRIHGGAGGGTKIQLSKESIIEIEKILKKLHKIKGVNGL